MVRRHTIQKEIILKTVRDLNSHVTADDVYSAVIRDYPNIGKGTVYRNLNLLAEEGEIRRVEISDGPDRFDFTLEDHYHVVCVKCKNVSDVDMDALPDLTDCIKDTHGMEFLNYDILFKGICKDCQQRKEA